MGPARGAEEAMASPPAAHVGGDRTTATATATTAASVAVASPEPPDHNHVQPPAPQHSLRPKDPQSPQPHTWPTSLTEVFADLKKHLALLQPPSSTTTSTPPAPVSVEAARTSVGYVAVRETSVHPDAGDVVDRLSRGPLASPIEDAAVDASLFRVPPRFAMPASAPSPWSPPAAGPNTGTSPGVSTATGTTTRTQDVDRDGRRRAGASQSQAHVQTSLTARRLVQLSGPAGSVTWALDGMVRGVGAPVGPGYGSGAMGSPWGTPNMTGVVGQRGSVSGTIGAASLHGGVNVLLGGAMLSGLILLVFFICYCCQRSARKADTHFRTQYWLPDPDGPLEVFTLDAQTQRLERAGAVLLATEQQMLDGVAASPSPPPAYHTVVNLPPPSKQPGDVAVVASPAPSPSSASSLVLPAAAYPRDDVLAKDMLCPAATSWPTTAGSMGLNDDVDVDGLPSYEAALKFESQGHI